MKEASKQQVTYSNYIMRSPKCLLVEECRCDCGHLRAGVNNEAMRETLLAVNMHAFWQGGFDVCNMMFRDPAICLAVIPHKLMLMCSIVVDIHIH
eukprot:m.149253 g.149253  ORF g.149253 m.149253 type:complete len:95 (+) comp16155_c2_seq1:273-557(+)